MSLLLPEIASMANGRLSGVDRAITSFITDSRHLHVPENSLFIALNGARNDGHSYIPDVLAAGVKAILCSDKQVEQAGISYIYVEDGLRAFQHLASAYRARFTYPVIGITGSYGKTMVKDQLAQILAARFAIVRSPRSYNSQVGVPISIMDMRSDHELAIFEAGISLPGEMATLASIIDPDIAIITSIGGAHDEGFENQTQKINEKLGLAANASVIIYPRDVGAIHRQVQALPNKEQKLILGWGKNPSSDLHIVAVESTEEYSQLTYCIGGKSFRADLPLREDYDLDNFMSIVTCLHALDLSEQEVAQLLTVATSMHQDTELLSTHYGLGMLSDIGDLDASRIRTGIVRLRSLLGRNQVQVILCQTDGSTLGNDRKIQALTEALRGHEVLCIGEGLKSLSDAIEGAVCLPSIGDFMQRPEDFLNPKASYLLQGVWSPSLAALNSTMSAQSHQTQVQINLQAMVQNLGAYRSLLPSTTRIMAMVKAFAYGSGGAEIARLLAFHKVDYLGVAYADEGVLLRRKGVLIPIMVLNSSQSELALMIRYRLEPEIYSLEMLEYFIALCEKKHIKAYPVHLEFNTGMHRLGFEPNEVGEVIRVISQTQSIRVRTVFTHLYASDGDDISLAHTQLDLFEAIRKDFKALDPTILFHALNSAGITRFPDASYDMVRLGIGLYGFSGDQAFNDGLIPILSWTSSISQVRDVAAGETVGYGGILRLERALRIAVIPVGYADGIDRSLSNGVGGVYIGTQFCPFVGKICMDMSMIDLGELSVKPGDTVEIIGTNQSIEDLASAANTIPYEILTGIPPRVKRSYVWLG